MNVTKTGPPVLKSRRASVPDSFGDLDTFLMIGSGSLPYPGKRSESCGDRKTQSGRRHLVLGSLYLLETVVSTVPLVHFRDGRDIELSGEFRHCILEASLSCDPQLVQSLGEQNVSAAVGWPSVSRLIFSGSRRSKCRTDVAGRLGRHRLDGREV
jgi:hypothetical protein